MLEITDIIFLAFAAFTAGLIDAAVGGGGLIQLPALMSIFPNPSIVLGTNKLASAFGTLTATRTFLKRVTLPWGLILPAALSAFLFSFVGAATTSWVPAWILKPTICVLLILMIIYTLFKKDFGSIHQPKKVGLKEKYIALVIGSLIGFYDGLFGPGTGSFLIFLFIRYFAFDFLHASASAKVVNLATNIAALCFFIPNGNVIFQVALAMAVMNVCGAITGVKLAMHYGTKFIRIAFLILSIGLVSKLIFEFIR